MDITCVSIEDGYLALQAEMMGGGSVNPLDLADVLDARARRRPEALLVFCGCLALVFLLLDTYLWSRRPRET